MSHKILVAQGGGPTAVINQSMAGVALEARRFPAISHVYGARYGVRGIVDDDLVDLGQETVANLEAVAATPAAALGTSLGCRILRVHDVLGTVRVRDALAAINEAE